MNTLAHQGDLMGERLLKQLRLATNKTTNLPARLGLQIISAMAGVLYSLAVTAQVQFTDVANQAGIAGDTYESRTTHGLGVNWIDYDNDGWPDLFAVNGWNSDGEHLFRNEGNGTFSDQDALLPVLPNLEMMGSVFADYDNDGDSDIYIFTDNNSGPIGPSAGPANVLLKNMWVENGNAVIPGQPLFVDVSVAANVDDLLDSPLADGPAYRSATGGWLDYDRDGNVDLYVCHWDRKKHGQSTNRDRLYRNLGNGTFEDVTDTSGIVAVTDGTYERPCLAFIGAHLDDDLWPDIYVGNVDAPLPFGRDYIFQNNGGTGFTDRTLDSPGVGDDADAAMGVTVADIDFNGGWDIYISDLQANPAPLGNPLYLHTGSGIIYNDNSADVAGVQSANSWGVNFLDVDHDGYEDLFVATMGSTAGFLYMNNQNGTFTAHPGGLGPHEARGSAYADFDRDGDLDIAVAEINGTLQLHRNDSVNQRHWLQIQLVSNDSNRDAIGTLVKINANSKTYMRQVIGGDSGHGQNSLDLHFGLGAATTIDQIEVYWPSGATAVLTNQPVDTFMAISEVGTSVALVSPLPNNDITSASTTFNWMSDGAIPVDSWQIMAGSTPGASNYFNSGSLAAGQLSAAVTGLPTNGAQIFVRLQYELSGITHHIDYQYGSSNQGPGSPAITSPVPGSILSAGDVSFVWTGNGAVADDWQLLVGTSVGDNSLYDSGVLPVSTTSALVSGLPEDGSTLHVTLRWTDGGSPSETNYTYTASSGGGSGGVPMMLAPLDGATLSGSSETFTWSAEGAAVEKWRLEVGTTSGGTNLFASGLGATITSQVVTGLPTDGSSVYVNLKWRIAGVTSVASYVYTAATDDPPPPGTPEITSPAPGSTLAAGDVSFSWNSNGATVDDWQLLVGTSVGGSSLHDSGVLPVTTTSTAVSGLPEDSSTIHVTLRWNESGSPSEVNYTYTASAGGGTGGVPMMLSPSDGATLAGSSETFAWSAEGVTVTKWRLEVGTSAGSRNLYSASFDAATTSALVSGLPTDGSPVYVSLKWRIGGVTTVASYVYTAADDGGPPPGGTPAITSPADGATLAGASETFTWSAEGAVVTRWRLEVGTTPGGTDIYAQNQGSTVTSTLVSGLPTDGSPVYVTLKWRIGTVTSVASYTYTASGP